MDKKEFMRYVRFFRDVAYGYGLNYVGQALLLLGAMCSVVMFTWMIA